MIKDKTFRKWYSKNKEKQRKTMKDYYEQNKEQVRFTSQESRYNKPKKNKIREIITREIEERKINKILTLESKDFLFSKLLPEKKIIVFEKDKSEYNLMEKRKPKNVSVFFGDISKFSDLNSEVECIYLDFCGIYPNEKEVIYNLKEQIKKCRLFIVTFSMRVNKENKEGFRKYGDYQFDLIRRIQELTEINWQVVYGEAYRDVQPMVTIIFENGGLHD